MSSINTFILQTVAYPGWTAHKDLDCSYNDIIQLNPATPGYCQSQCEATPNCVAILFYTSQATCYLKSLCADRLTSSTESYLYLPSGKLQAGMFLVGWVKNIDVYIFLDMKLNAWKS